LMEAADLRLVLSHKTASNAPLALATCNVLDPTGYGRVLRDEQHKVIAIREQRDLENDDQRAIREINPGIYVAEVGWLRDALAGLEAKNAQGELYMTDIVERAAKGGERVTAIDARESVLFGVNDRVQLFEAEKRMHRRIRAKHQRAGVTVRGGTRQSLFRHFHGRSSLATWLRAVLAQRHIDRIRASRRVEPLPEDESPRAIASRPETVDPERRRYLALIERALAGAVAALAARDRLRLGCYYAQGMTLAKLGQLLGEHEATVSRHLARTRRIIREDIERQLRLEGLGDAEMAQCLESVLDDAGPIDLSRMLASGSERKESEADRSLLRRGTL